MTFPVIMKHPTFSLTLPASKLQVEYRPFLEMERKILLMALESDIEKDVFNTVKQLIKSCCLTDIDVEKMALIDIEYFFLQLRAKSVGEVLNLVFVCKNVVDKTSCEHELNISVNVNDIKVENLDPNDLKIELTPEIGVMMNYPGLISSDKSLDDIEFLYDIAVSCIEYVYSGENSYFAKDYKKEDLYFFITNLTSLQFNKIQKFISNAPVLRKKMNHRCEKCGYIHNVTMEGLQSFFA